MRSTASDGHRISIEEYADLPDDGWWTELVQGQVVREPQPGSDQGRVQAATIRALSNYVRDHASKLVCIGNVGAITDGLAGTVRGPDAAVVRRSRLRDLGRAGFLRGAPDLAIEIVSPSNRAGEIQAKVKEYLMAGAQLVWVIYPEARTVAVHASGAAHFLGEQDVLTGGEVLPQLRLHIAELFSD